MHSRTFSFLLGAALPAVCSANLNFLTGIDVPRGGEIVAFDAVSGSILTTNSFDEPGFENHAINIYNLSAAGALTFSSSVNLNSFFGGATDILSVSSVAVDPLGRDFGVASIIPKTNNTSQGVVALFQISTGTILNSLQVGYHPDSVTFTPGGGRILVANEGEFVTAGPQAPGSVSIIDVSSVGSGASGLNALSAAQVRDVDFASDLAPGVNLTGLRNNRLDTLAGGRIPDALDVEPEFISANDQRAFVTLQENNAIAVVDLASGLVEDIHVLGTISQRIDASDRDGAGGGAGISINDTVQGMPMPDTIVQFVQGGQRLLATANEGDFRLDDADRIRVRDARTNGITDPVITSAIANNAVLGRLRISTIDGDTDANGRIDTPTMPGTRSFSIWDAETGALVFDSGSMIEEFVAANDPTTFGIELGDLSTFDTRSDDKGPEPEGLAFGSVFGRDYLFVGAERQNGIFQFDVTDLNSVFIAGYYNTITRVEDNVFGTFIAPESLQFIPAHLSPTGQALLIVGYEGEYAPADGYDLSGSIAVFSVIPEPSHWALLAGGLGLASALVARRRASRRS